MRIGVLGTGTVGRTVGGKLAEVGHEVVLGTRDPAALASRTEKSPMEPESFADWHAAHPDIPAATFSEAAAHGELLVLALNGAGTLEALRSAGAQNLQGKTILDITNPLDFSRGMPPSLFVSNTDSLAEQVQRAFPSANVVKSLNTVTARVMVEPGMLADGEHTMFVAGDDVSAKAEVVTLLRDGFGWKHVLDLGDLSGARAMEMYMPLWLRLFSSLGTPFVNVRVVS